MNFKDCFQKDNLNESKNSNVSEILANYESDVNKYKEKQVKNVQ